MDPKHDRGINSANTPVDWNGPAWDRPMWFTNPPEKKFHGGYERTFGDRCEACGKHMDPIDGRLLCVSCGHERKFSDEQSPAEGEAAAQAGCHKEDGAGDAHGAHAASEEVV